MTSNDYLLVSALKELTDGTPYQRGVLDVLRLLGLITVEEGRAQPTGEVARMVLDSLIAHAGEQVSVGFDWNDLDSEGLRGVNILRAFEAQRAERAEAGPGRRVQVVQ